MTTKSSMLEGDVGEGGSSSEEKTKMLGREAKQEEQERGGEEEQEVHWKAADPGLEKVRLDNKQFLMLRIGNLYCDMS